MKQTHLLHSQTQSPTNPTVTTTYTWVEASAQVQGTPQEEQVDKLRNRPHAGPEAMATIKNSHRLPPFFQKPQY